MKREKDIENTFRLQCKLNGCKAIKMIDPSEDGAPDRMVLTPWGLVFFVEFKRPDEKPRRNQLKYMLKLNEWGFLAFTATEPDTPTSLILMLGSSVNRHELYQKLCTSQVERFRNLLK